MGSEGLRAPSCCQAQAGSLKHPSGAQPHSQMLIGVPQKEGTSRCTPGRFKSAAGAQLQPQGNISTKRRCFALVPDAPTR